MRRKLRLTVVITLTVCSGLWAILLAMSVTHYFDLTYSPIRGVTFGSLTIDGGGCRIAWVSGYEGGWSGSGPPPLGWSATAAWLHPMERRMWIDTVFAFAREWSSEGSELRWMLQFPVWLAVAAFGLWPAIVVVRAIRRRRQQVRGFDATPAQPS